MGTGGNSRSSLVECSTTRLTRVIRRSRPPGRGPFGVQRSARWRAFGDWRVRTARGARVLLDGYGWCRRGTAIYYNFGKGSQALYRQTDGEIGRAFAVRCVRD